MNKTGSMKQVIDDLIKGAQHNTFGRPVSVEGQTDFGPLQIAKIAGALQALSEAEYSVKEAAEYLGLTEAQVQRVIETVR